MTHALILRHGGYATGPVPPMPERLSDWVTRGDMALPAPGPGKVLIRVALSPVNPSDLYFVQGGYGQPRQAGMAAGFEGTGTVTATGPGTEALMGKRVAFLATQTGAWAQETLTDAAFCIPLRDDLADHDAAALIVNPLTALAMVDMVPAGGAFILNAAGSQLGRLMLALARDRGLGAVAVIRRRGDEDALRALGATDVLVSSEHDFASQLGAAIKTTKARIFLDAVGDQTAAAIFTAMPSGAQWVVYGKMSTDAPALTHLGQLIFMDKTIRGFWLSRWLPATPPERRAALAAEVQARFVSGAWTTRLGAVVGLDPDALDAALRDARGKVMVRP
jgi:NADPH:quinone reductase-like Zn-dependent oxidoreductase